MRSISATSLTVGGSGGEPRSRVNLDRFGAVARKRPHTERAPRPTPPPLPPGSRTVGQLVAETLRLYGRRFWRSLALGVPVGIIDTVAIGLSRSDAVVFEAVVGGPLLTISYVAASVLASDRPRPPVRQLVLAWLVGTLVFLPFPVLAFAFVLPALAWLALVGL